MIGVLSPRDLRRRIEERLSAVAARIERPAASAWTAAWSNGKEVSIGVRLDAEWLTLRAPVPASVILPRETPGAKPATDPWALLAVNATLPAGIKLALPGAGEPLSLQAEIPVEAHERFPETLASLRGSVEMLAAGGTGPNGVGEAGAESSDAIERVGRLCAEAGWPASERPGGALRLDLDVPDGFGQARITVRRSGRVSAATELSRVGGGAPPAACRAAVGWLLLRASGALRMARAVSWPGPASAAGDDTPVAVGFEVLFERSPSAVEIDHALSALSVACRQWGRETVVLMGDAAVAEEFLGMADFALSE